MHQILIKSGVICRHNKHTHISIPRKPFPILTHKSISTHSTHSRILFFITPLPQTAPHFLKSHFTAGGLVDLFEECLNSHNETTLSAAKHSTTFEPWKFPSLSSSLAHNAAATSPANSE